MASSLRLPALAVVVLLLSPSALCEPEADGASIIVARSGQDCSYPADIATPHTGPAPSSAGPLAQAAMSDGSCKPIIGSSGSERVCPSDTTLVTGPFASSSYPVPCALYPVPLRSGPDVAPVSIEYLGPDPEIGVYGAAQVGKPTQFNITIMNSGDADASPVALRVTVADYFGNIVGDYSTSIPSIAMGASAVASWKYWTPAFCTQFSVNATVNTAGDANITNNTLVLTGLWAEKWIDDCTSATGWTGDISPGKWGITATDPWPGGHSGPGAWHCGQDGYYLNDTDASLVSPPIDLSRMNPNYYILFNFDYHGGTSAGDAIDTYISDDDGATWYSIFARLEDKIALDGWYSWVSHWEDYDQDQVVDDNEPHQEGLDISKFCGRTINIKFRFTSDGSYNAVGFYLDDMVIRGWENLNDVALLSIGAGAVEKLGVEQTFNATIRNLGQSAQDPFQAYLNISDGTSLSKTVTAMQPGELRTVSWTWTPALPGNYTVQCTVLLNPDEVQGDNSLWRPIHIAAGKAGMLLVDDDTGPGNNGALRGTSGADVEWAEEEALTMAEYDLYIVGDDDGPTADILRDYGLVIWVTGYDDAYTSRAGTLTARDRSGLATYMDEGGRLLLVSFETMWDTWTVWGDKDFVIDYLHVMSFDPLSDDDAGMPATLEGLQGDPITDGMSFDTADPPPGLWDKSDQLHNASDSPGIFYQYDFAKDPLSGPFNALRHVGKTKLVFLAFELTFIETPDNRSLLVSRALEWLWGGVSLLPGKGGVQGAAIPLGNVTYNISLLCSEQRGWSVESLGPGTAPPGWEAQCDITVANGTPPLALSSMQAMPLRLMVTVPAGAPSGMVGIATLMVRMAGSPYAISIITQTTVLPVSGVSLSCGQPVLSAPAGGEAIFMVSVTNEGNHDSQVNLSLRGEAAPWCQLSRSSLFLSGGGYAFVQVAAELPAGVAAGMHNLTVRAQTPDAAGMLQAELGLTISVNATHNLKIEGSPAGKVVNLAETLQTAISVEMSNYGNVEENAVVSVCATFSGWEQWQLPSRSLQMVPFEKGATVMLDVGIPSTAATGYYNLTVRLGYASGELADKRNTVIELRLPDLTVSAAEVRLSPPKPQPGDSVELSAVVRNNGTADARNISVAFTLNERQAGVWHVPEAVPPGLTVTASVFYRGIRYGDNVLRIVVDPDNGILESSKQNNQVEVHVFGYQPDLSAGAVTFQAVGRAQPRDNRSVSEGMVEVSAVIYNGGDFCIDADNVDVNFSVNGVVFETRVVSVPAGSQAVATALWFSKKGDARLQVTVDPGNHIDESSEYNNEASLSVKVQGTAAATPDMGQWIPLAVGIIAVAIMASAFAFRSLRSKGEPAAPARVEGMRSFRAKPGSSRACARCGKPIEGGTGYLKCEECDARYHPECASSGICHRCAEKEVADEKDG